MGLKRYYIDTSPLSGEAQKQAIDFIESASYNSQYIPGSKGCFFTFWPENEQPALLPSLSQCIVKELS